MEHRSDSGFDSRLPGSGLLVSYHDLSVGDIERNEVNTNPNLPWLKVVEADEGEDLVRGSNQGEASDVFVNNTRFGAEGVKIRTHDGVLVPWVATFSGDDNLSVSFSAPNCTPGFTLDLNDHGTTVLPAESVPVSIVGATETCTSELTSSDGRGVGLVNDEGTYRIQFSMQGTPNSVATVAGTVTCEDSVVDIEHTVHVLNRIPSVGSYSAVVHPESTTVLNVPLPSDGAGEQRLFVHLDGPLERVANVPTSIILADEAGCTLTVEPNGLLSENMLIHGELILSTDEGQRWVIDVELEATAIPDSWWTPWIEPGRVIGLMLAVLGLSALSTVVAGSKTETDAPKPSDDAQVPAVEAIDPWGRPIDGMDSANSLDVQK